jgi:adenine-specific DNA-methyltransferase
MEMFESLKNLLKNDERLVSDDKLLKNKIVELGLKLDKELIKLLLTNERIKDYFFKDIDGVLVFDKEKFVKFIDNKEFLPDSYTSFKNKIGLAVDGNYIAKSKEAVLVWPYKDCILEGGQENPDEKRREIFYNEILAPDEIDRLLDPKVFTNFKRIDKEGEHKVEEIKTKDNIIIKGNNLLALYSLKKKFAGKVKLIYIDPPYNTGNDEFKYNDSFNHSTWLTFMKNRLEVAREFLRDDGVIFVQIDNRELAYLKVLIDEIFGRDNFLSMITLKAKAGGGVGQESYIFDVCEYILSYARDRTKARNNLPFVETDLGDNVKTIYNKILTNFGSEKHIKDINGGNVGKIKVFEHKDFSVSGLNSNERTDENYYKYFEKIFRTTNPQGGLMQRVMPQLPKKGLVSIEYKPTKGKSAGEIYRYYFLDGSLIVWLKDSAIKNEEEITVSKLVKNDNLWTENLHQGIAKEGYVELKAGKKPERLIKKILEMTTIEGDLVLDYHIGSGTSCAVAHKMGRQYIGVEQLDYGENDSVVRLKNVIKGDQTGISKEVNWQGGGDFVYMEIMKLNENFMERIQDAKDSEALLSIWEEMKLNGFLSYRVDPKLFDENIEEFKKLPIDEQKRLLLETLDKNYLYVNYSEIDDEMYKVKDEDKKLNMKFYGGNENA